MINVNKAKAMPKGWKNFLSVNVKSELNYFSNENGYASTRLSELLVKQSISDTMLVTKEDLLTYTLWSSLFFVLVYAVR